MDLSIRLFHVNNGLDAVESGIYMLEDAMFLLRLWRRVLSTFVYQLQINRSAISMFPSLDMLLSRISLALGSITTHIHM
jgi:hypothetical protein